jgi:HSP20 family protein
VSHLVALHDERRKQSEKKGEVNMTLIKHHETKLEPFDRIFGQWPEFFRRPIIMWSGDHEDLLRVEEYEEDGTRVIRAEMPGIDPDKDVEITVDNGVLHISAERKEEEKSETKDYTRREIRYGLFTRDISLPQGCVEADLKATYKDGMLEIRVPSPVAEAKKVHVQKIPVTTG